nr:MAG TPA: N-terminal region of 4Fe-4S ferredoxin iron-sulfur binding [Caudoviricetes sp.]
MQGEISEDEFVEQYNRLIEQEAEKHWEPVEPHEHAGRNKRGRICGAV